MIIIGAGAIGVEFAYIYNAFGTKVTLVEMLPRILPVEDDEVGDALEKSLIKQGIRCLTNTKITATADHGTHVELTVEGPKENGTITRRCLPGRHRHPAGASRRHAARSIRPRLHQGRRPL